MHKYSLDMLKSLDQKHEELTKNSFEPCYENNCLPLWTNLTKDGEGKIIRDERL